ncbi:hypothetical protein BGZ65_001036 [Modicella reniformis]|uniref:Mid2 domain-containing protein n=1 Tax=Modicella reniformis TaxID=1440133 RepID=A0A9P6SPY4_9FUNG|nr:hypothetical protein BGZ65_001036 [Modicella reniformis]
MTSTFPTSPTISISLTILPITTTSTTSKYMKSTHSPIPSPVPSNNTDIDNAINNNGGSKKGMSGGAVVGLVFGILALLVCSVVGGFMLLKLRRRKRMMLAGREGHNGYRDTSSSSKEYGNNGSEDDEDGEKSRGAFAGLLPGFISKARKTASGGSLARTNVAIQQQQQQQLLQPRPMSPGCGIAEDARGQSAGHDSDIWERILFPDAPEWCFTSDRTSTM